MADMQKKRCFIITPIGSDEGATRRHIEGVRKMAISPALGDTFIVTIAHDIPNPGSITKQVIQEIYKSDLVIVNLTQRNPNVMYELGLRHCFGKPAITIAEKGTDLPADVITERTIFYQNDPLGMDELQGKPRAAVASIKFDEIASPVYDFLPELSTAPAKTSASEPASADYSTALDGITERLDTLKDSLAEFVEGFAALMEGLADEYDLIDHSDVLDDIVKRLDHLESKCVSVDYSATLSSIMERLGSLESKCTPADYSATLDSILRRMHTLVCSTADNRSVLDRIEAAIKIGQNSESPATQPQEPTENEDRYVYTYYYTASFGLDRFSPTALDERFIAWVKENQPDVRIEETIWKEYEVCLTLSCPHKLPGKITDAIAGFYGVCLRENGFNGVEYLGAQLVSLPSNPAAQKTKSAH